MSREYGMAPGSTNPQSRLGTISAVAVPLLAAAAYLSWLPLSAVHGFFSDDAVFLLLADYFSEPGAASTLLQTIRENSQFPVLFPLLLAALGGGADAPVLSAGIDRLLLVGALAVLFAFTRRAASSGTASLTLLVVLLLPSTTIFALELWSEFLFMLLAYAALLLVSGRASRNNLMLASAMVVMACLTRTAGLSLLLAFWAWLLYWRHPRWGLLILATGFLVGFSLLLGAGSSNAMWYFHASMDSSLHPARLGLAQLGIRIGDLAEAWTWQFAPVPNLATNGLANWVAASILALAFIGWAMRLRRVKLDALWLPIYLGMVLLWPFQQQVYLTRFLYPIAPLVAFYALCAVRHAPPKPRAALAIVVLVITVIATAPTLGQFQHRLTLQTDPSLRPYTVNRWWLTADSDDTAREGAQIRRDVISGLQAARALIAPEDCVYAGHPPLVVLHARRVAWKFDTSNSQELPGEAFFPLCQSLIATPMVLSDAKVPPYYPAAMMNLEQFHVTTLPEPSAKHAVLLVQTYSADHPKATEPCVNSALHCDQARPVPHEHIIQARRVVAGKQVQPVDKHCYSDP